MTVALNRIPSLSHPAIAEEVAAKSYLRLGRICRMVGSAQPANSFLFSLADTLPYLKEFAEAADRFDCREAVLLGSQCDRLLPQPGRPTPRDRN